MAIKTAELSLNGTTYAILYDSTVKRYKKKITAPTKSSFSQAGNKYAMSLKVTDEAGNVTTIDKDHVTFGSKMLLRVVEKVAPVITITKPGAGSYLTSNTVPIEFTVLDNDSGVNANSISLQIDSQTAITGGLTKVAITGGYRCTYTATIADGSHTIKINASDNDGNAAVQKTAAFTVDTVPPTLNISTPPASLITNIQNCTVSGITNDVTSAPVVVKITLNGSDQGAVTVNSSGSFSKSLSLVKGTNTIVITSTDKAGKSSIVDRTVVYDPDAPVIVSIDISPNPVDAESEITVTVEATD